MLPAWSCYIVLCCVVCAAEALTAMALGAVAEAVVISHLALLELVAVVLTATMTEELHLEAKAVAEEVGTCRLREAMAAGLEVLMPLQQNVSQQLPALSFCLAWCSAHRLFFGYD